MKKLLLLFVFSFIIILSGCVSRPSDNTSMEQQKESLFSFNETSFEFGKIKQSGGKVLHDFTFTYNGETPIKITGVPTSCACVSATIDKTELKKGDSGVVTVKFNPNLHAEPDGKFFKTIMLLTEPKLDDIPELKIWVEIDLDLGEEVYELKFDHDEEEEEEDEGLESYTSITAEQFVNMNNNKDFVLVDVHIPEQLHIEGTDLFIPYDSIEDYEDQLPKDKNAKIVLYCRSGGMSRAAAYILTEHGYTNVYDLMGGKNAYDEYMENSSQ